MIRALQLSYCVIQSFALAGSLQPATPAPPSPPSQPLPPLTHYMGREIATTMHWTGAEWLLRESREKEENTALLLQQLSELANLRPGAVVADVGAGNGYYSLRMASEVGPTGKVLAVEIQEEYLAMLRARATEAGVTNVEPVLGTLTDPNLPPDGIDLVLLVDVYHEFSHPEQMLASLRRCLRPPPTAANAPDPPSGPAAAAGRIALVEFRAEDPDVPIKPLHKMSKDQIRKEWEANGFRIVQQFDGLPWQHLVILDADPAWAAPGSTTSRDE